jgi:tetratricopeptide (TPR) repeat protein
VDAIFVCANRDQRSGKEPESLFEEVILKGEESYKLKDYPVAKRYFEKALEIDPSSRYARIV